jgi:HEAT repeat protein
MVTRMSHRNPGSRSDEDDGNRLTETAELALGERGAKGEDPHLRRYSLHLLGSLHDPRYLDLFVRALHDPDKGVREQAGRALASLGRPAIGRCFDLLTDPDWKVRYRAAEALGLSGVPEARRGLLVTITDEEDHVRYMGAKGLGLLGSGADAGPLAGLLTDKNPYVRTMAARSLGKIGGETACRVLKYALNTESDPGVAAAIRESLSSP